MTPEQKKALAIAAARQRRAQQYLSEPPPAAPPEMMLNERTGQMIDTSVPGADKSYSGSYLPFSVDAAGNGRFDSNTGLLGAAKRIVGLPGEVYRGEVDPNSPEGIDRALEMAMGVSPVNPAFRASGAILAGGKPNLKPAKVQPPTAAELKDEAKAGYNAFNDLNVEYDSAAVQRLAEGSQLDLERQGFRKKNAPKTFDILKALSNPPENSVATNVDLHAAIKAAQKAGQDFNNPTDQAGGRAIREALRGFIAKPGDESVLRGPADRAGAILREADGNHAARKRAEDIAALLEKGERRAAASNSGQNIGNTLRGRVASTLDAAKRSQGYNADEIAALNQISNGSRTANATRWLGNFAGGGGGLAAQTATGIGGAAGFATFGPLGAIAGAAAVPVVGGIAKGTSNRLTKKALRKFDEGSRKRSPLYERMQANAPLVAQGVNSREALIKALLLQQAQLRDETVN